MLTNSMIKTTFVFIVKIDFENDVNRVISVINWLTNHVLTNGHVIMVSYVVSTSRSEFHSQAALAHWQYPVVLAESLTGKAKPT